MKFKLCFVILVLSSAGYATEWDLQSPWYMKGDLTAWQRCRYRGIDLVGEAKLVSFDPAKSNEGGVVATFQFTDMMKGLPGEYVVTIPDSMRNPMNMLFDMASWNKTKQLEPWQWKNAETYGVLCITNFDSGIRMVDWVVPRDKWGSFKKSVEKEHAEFVAFVKEKKLEMLKLESKINNILDREEIEDEEKDARWKLLSDRRHELYIQVQEAGLPYFIFDFDWDNPEQTWP